MTERTDHTPEPADEETLDTPVKDGTDELRAEADAAVESGQVDLSDTTHRGPTMVEEERQARA